MVVEDSSLVGSFIGFPDLPSQLCQENAAIKMICEAGADRVRLIRLRAPNHGML